MPSNAAAAAYFEFQGGTAPSHPDPVQLHDRGDYEEPSFGPEIFVVIAGLVYAITTFGISIIITMAGPPMSALMKVCDYILNGKLVCRSRRLRCRPRGVVRDG